ncbi:MAG: hypothetical protein ACMG57_00695 [Candidatus Dojkabacteria bacterium]
MFTSDPYSGLEISQKIVERDSFEYALSVLFGLNEENADLIDTEVINNSVLTLNFALTNSSFRSAVGNDQLKNIIKACSDIETKANWSNFPFENIKQLTLLELQRRGVPLQEAFNFQVSVRNIVGNTSRDYTDGLKRLSLFARNGFKYPFLDTVAYPTGDLALDLDTDSILDPETNQPFEEIDELDYINFQVNDEIMDAVNLDLEHLIYLLQEHGHKLHRSDIIVIRRTCLLLEKKPIYNQDQEFRNNVHELYTHCQLILHPIEG